MYSQISRKQTLSHAHSHACIIDTCDASQHTPRPAGEGNSERGVMLDDGVIGDTPDEGQCVSSQEKQFGCP